MGMNADFGRTARDYGKFRVGFPRSFFDALQAEGLVGRNEDVVDLGTGTGTVARGLASLGCRVIGIDPSSALLEEAGRLAEVDQVSVTWKRAVAEATELGDLSADIVVAGQCWHWFDAAATIRESRRILRTNGQLVISHFDWLPFSGNVVERTEHLIHEMNPGWSMGGGVGIYPEWFRHLAEGGFQGIRSRSHDEDVLYTHEAWRGRIRASAGVGGSLSPEEVEAFDSKHQEVLSAEFPEEPLVIPHRIFIVYGRKSGGSGFDVT